MAEYLLERLTQARIRGGLVWCVKTDSFRLDENLAKALGLGEHSVTVSGEAYRSHVHPKDLPRVRRLGAQAMMLRIPISVSYALRDAQGVYRDVKVEGFWIGNEAGELEAACNLVVEIDQCDETKADRIAEHALQIIQLASDKDELPIQMMAQTLMIHLMRLTAEQKV